MSELAKALLAFQKDAPVLHKAAESQIGSRRYKYTTLDELLAKVRPALNDVGLIVSQSLAFDAQVGLRTLDTSLIHAETGEKMQSWLVLPPTDDMQEFGKALTYARRQSLEAMLGVVGEEDTDGRRSAGEIATPDRVAGASAEQSGGVAAAPEPTPQDGQGQAPPDGFPPSIPETLPPKAKPGQIHEMRELLEQLELQEPRRNPTWRTMATAFAREQLDVQNWEKLTEPQMDTILDYMRPFLKEKVYPD